MKLINKRLAERNITIELTESAIAHISRTAYSPTYGARPLRRWLEKHVVSPISVMLIDGSVSDDSVVRVTTVVDEELKAAQLAVLSDDEFYADDEIGSTGVGSGGAGSEGLRLKFDVEKAAKKRRVDKPDVDDMNEDDVTAMD